MPVFLTSSPFSSKISQGRTVNQTINTNLGVCDIRRNFSRGKGVLIDYQNKLEEDKTSWHPSNSSHPQQNSLNQLSAIQLLATKERKDGLRVVVDIPWTLQFGCWNHCRLTQRLATAFSRVYQNYSRRRYPAAHEFCVPDAVTIIKGSNSRS